MERESSSLPFPKEGFRTFMPWITRNQLCHIWTVATSNCRSYMYIPGSRPTIRPTIIRLVYTWQRLIGRLFLFLVATANPWGLVCTFTRHTPPGERHTLPFRRHHLSIFLQGTGQMLVLLAEVKHTMTLAKQWFKVCCSPRPQLHNLSFFHLTRLCRDRRTRS